MRLDPAVAATRLAVRRIVAAPSSGPVLVACSGGADSLALLAATVFEARSKRRREPGRVVGVTVDHGLQQGSADRAKAVVDQMAELGADETACVAVSVDPRGSGVEAAARESRYDALRELAGRLGSQRVLVGHTRDDQAETVLMGLTRGSGGRSIAGMPGVVDGLFFRPFLDLTRAQTEAACRAQGIEFWTDPHNADPCYTRARIRHTVMPVLERELGPGVAAALARTGEMLRDDMGLLDGLAEEAYRAAGGSAGLDVGRLVDLPASVRRRVLRRGALEAGSPGAELFHLHVAELDRLATDWHGQSGVDLPGRLRAVRADGRIVFRAG